MLLNAVSLQSLRVVARTCDGDDLDHVRSEAYAIQAPQNLSQTPHATPCMRDDFQVTLMFVCNDEMTTSSVVVASLELDAASFVRDGSVAEVAALTATSQRGALFVDWSHLGAPAHLVQRGNAGTILLRAGLITASGMIAVLAHSALVTASESTGNGGTGEAPSGETAARSSGAESSSPASTVSAASPGTHTLAVLTPSSAISIMSVPSRSSPPRGRALRRSLSPVPAWHRRLQLD
jgi:hypothetical protein